MIGRRTVAIVALIFLLYSSAHAVPCDIVCMIGGSNPQHDHMHERPAGSAAPQNVHAHHHGAAPASEALVSPSVNVASSTMRAAPACEPALISAPRFKVENSDPNPGVTSLTACFSVHDDRTPAHVVSSFRDLGPPGLTPVISVLRI